MSLSQALIAEMKFEAVSTRKLFEQFPSGHNDFKPHEKSMPFGYLCSHLARLPEWAEMIVEGDGLDLAAGFDNPPEATTSAELIDIFDQAVATFERIVSAKSDEQLMADWTLRNGDQVLMVQPKAQVVRSWILNHFYHHRGQLTVYLRLLGKPLPQVYGPSADEPGF